VKVVNRTGYAFVPLMGRVHFPAHTATLVVKAAFRLVPGGECVPVDEQPGIEGDVLSKAKVPECLYDADMAPFKPHADVLFTGNCYAPGGTPVTTCPVLFRVGSWAKALACIGNRKWHKGMLLSKMGEIEPFTSVAVSWANAFGGPDFADNPAGKGHRDGVLPNVEIPGHLIKGVGDKPTPAGFGPVHRTWRPRTRKGGTYDKKWLKDRFPAFPADFDWSHFNAAPQDQQLSGFLRGDEDIELKSLHAQHSTLISSLPGRRVRILLREGKEGEQPNVREVPMNLDTLAVDGDKGEVTLLWRGVADVSDEDWLECRDILVVSEGLEDNSSMAQLLPLFDEEPEEVEAEEIEPPEPTQEEKIKEIDALIANAEKLGKQYMAQVRNSVKAQAKGAYGGSKLLPAAKKSPIGGSEAALAKALALLAPDEAKMIKGLKGAHFNPASDPHVKELLQVEKAMKPPKMSEGKKIAAMMKSGEARGGDFGGAELKQQDLEGADLSECYLTNADLAGANLKGAKLVDAIMPGANLSGADLTGADLTGADLTGANLAGAKFIDAKLGEAVLAGAKAEKAVFTGAKAAAVSCTGLAGAGADFSGADLTAAIFSEAQLAGAVFTGAKLNDAAFDGAKAVGAKFDGAELANFRGGEKSDFTGAVFTKAKAAGSIWEKSVLAKADFGEADLKDSQFPFADLTGARLYAADLTGSNLRKCNLAAAQAGNANFFQARLEKANLTGGSFVASNFFEAEFLEATTKDADFSGANLKATKLAKA
jgi:uncharacterized protein YjbI with pentapeptide repeats